MNYTEQCAMGREDAHTALKNSLPQIARDIENACKLGGGYMAGFLFVISERAAKSHK